MIEVMLSFVSSFNTHWLTYTMSGKNGPP